MGFAPSNDVATSLIDQGVITSQNILTNFLNDAEKFSFTSLL